MSVYNSDQKNECDSFLEMISESYHNDALGISTRFRTTMTKPWEIAWMLWKLSSTPGNILEIGTHYGETTREFALAYPEKTIYALDHPRNDSIPSRQKQDLPDPRKVCESARSFPNVKLLLQDSKTLDYATLSEIGFVFIDGDHSFEGVSADSEKAFAYFAKRKGIIVWHDCFPHDYIAVYSFLEMLSQRWPERIRTIAGTTLAFMEFKI